jgi:hypothetical protein
MIKTFQYKFEDLCIGLDEIGLLMDYKAGEIPEPIPELIETELRILSGYCKIEGGFQTFDDIGVDKTVNSIRINHTLFFPGKIVTTQLKKSTSAALFICTAGPEISKLSKRFFAEGDLLGGYVLDVIGSVVVERAMDKIQDFLREEMNALGIGISDRYSPGYCNWDVADQQKLFSFFPANFCGVSLSESSLMDPIKSVSGIIGIGAGLEQKGYQCLWCNDKNCIYRRIKHNSVKE